MPTPAPAPIRSPAATPTNTPRPLILVPGNPDALAFTRDGRTLIVSFQARFGVGGGFAAYRRDGETYKQIASIGTRWAIESLALTPDERTIVATTRVGLAALDLAALVDGTNPKPFELRDGPAPDPNRIVVSRDGRYAFFTEQRSSLLGIARIARDSRDSPALEIVGHVALDRSPGGIAQSPDGRTLYVTSEVDNVDPARVAGANDTRLGRKRCQVNLGPHGVLSTIDEQAAISDPAHAVIARVAAGCAPARVALSPDGGIAWVSVRGESRVLAFDTAELVNSPSEALLAVVAVGEVPIGLAVSSNGKRLLVADSQRARDPDQTRTASLTLIDTAAALGGRTAVLATMPTGALAREVAVGPDGKFYVTNYLAHTVDAID